MKTKSKLVLALAVLTAGTAFAGASGTFAWFTVNRSAILSYSKVTAQATGPNLEATFLATIAGVTNTLTSGSGTQTASSAASFTSDISSGDGITMAKPNWITEAGGAGTGIAGVSQVTDVSKFFTRFIIKVTNTAADGQGDLDLYLDTHCAIKANATEAGDQKTKDDNLAKWTRVGVVYLGTSTPENAAGWVAAGGIKPVVFENADGGTKGKYVEVNPSANSLVYADISAETTNYSTAVSTDFVVDSSSTRSSKNFIGTVADGNTSVYLGVTVWMEGTELANQDLAKEGAVNIDIGLSSREAA